VLERWMNRGALITQTVEMTATAQSDIALLPLFPIQSVTSVKNADGDTLTNFTPALGGKFPSLSLVGSWAGPIKVTAVCGYGAAAAVPADLKLAMLLAISTMYDNRGELPDGFFDTLDHLLIGYRRQAVA
jgi:hypothetical protein